MDSVQKTPDYDYIITDTKGARKVFNGKESMITENEYRDLFPYHKDVGCKECTITQTKEEILSMKKGATKDTYLGLFALPGFTGHLPFFAFQCQYCNELFADYPNGGGYVVCGICRKSQPIKSKAVWKQLFKLGHYRKDGWTMPVVKWILFLAAIMILVLPVMFVDWLVSFFNDSKDLD